MSAWPGKRLPLLAAAVVTIAAVAAGPGRSAVTTSAPSTGFTCTWVGSAPTNDWQSAANWSNCNGTFPGAGDTVVVTSAAGSGLPDITSADASAGNIQVSGTGGFIVEVNRTLTVSNTGTSVFVGDHTTVSGTLAVGGPSTWAAGGYAGGGTIKITSGALMTIDPGSNGFAEFGPKLDNESTGPGAGVEVKAGTVQLDSGDAGTTTGAYVIDSGATLLANAGAFDAPSITGSGTFTIRHATVTVGPTQTFSPGTLAMTSDGELTLNANTSIPNLSFAGGVRDGTGTLTITATAVFPLGVAQFTGGTTTIADTVTTSPVTFNDGQLLLSNAVLNLDVPATWSANQWTLESNSTLNVNSSLSLPSVTGTLGGDGTSVLHIGSNGSINFDPGAGKAMTVAFTKVDNDGTVTVKSGILDLQSGDANSTTGSYTIDATTDPAATLEIGGGTFQSPSVKGSGTFDIQGATVTVGGTDAFTPTTVDLKGFGTLTVNNSASISNLVVDSGTRDGTGTFTVTGSVNGDAHLALNGGTTAIASSVSPLTLTNGALTLANSTLNLDTPTTWAGNEAIGMSSATLNVNSTFALSVDSLGLSGGPDSALNVGATGSMTVNPGANGSDVVGVPINNAHTVTVTSGSLGASGGFTQSAGTTTVASAAKLTGPVTLNGGTLKGNGLLTGPVDNVAGTVAPGSSPGTLTITGDYTQEAGGTLAEEITGTTPGTQFDQLPVGGALSLNGTLAIDSATFTPASIDTFKIISGAISHVGAFASLTGATVNGVTYSARYDSDGVTLLVSGSPPPPPNETLSVAFAGTGGGSVSDGSTLNCAASCQHQYPQGTVVTLTATAASGSSFAGWSGACAGTGDCQVTMSAAQSVTATFDTVAPPPPPVVGTPPAVTTTNLFCGVKHRGKCKGLKCKATFDRPGNAAWTFAAYNASPGHKSVVLGTVKHNVTGAGTETVDFKLRPGARTKQLYKHVEKLGLHSIRVTLSFDDGTGQKDVTTKRVRLK